MCSVKLRPEFLDPHKYGLTTADPLDWTEWTARTVKPYKCAVRIGLHKLFMQILCTLRHEPTSCVLFTQISCFESRKQPVRRAGVPEGLRAVVTVTATSVRAYLGHTVRAWRHGTYAGA
jgi:hypothetical protein